MVTSEITKDNKTLLICYKNSYPCGQILYNGSRWIYITSVDINKVLNLLKEIIKELDLEVVEV